MTGGVGGGGGGGGGGGCGGCGVQHGGCGVTCAINFSGVVNPSANASAIPLASVTSTANTPTRIGLDFENRLLATMLSIGVSVK
ncbi:MAG TPA: hypothetical protein VEA92_01025 [Candidatus Paceibacterota bacterium]|nr:hypothetical protein [Candidatus Paceibacterota bacterium]